MFKKVYMGLLILIIFTIIAAGCGGDDDMVTPSSLQGNQQYGYITVKVLWPGESIESGECLLSSGDEANTLTASMPGDTKCIYISVRNPATEQILEINGEPARITIRKGIINNVKFGPIECGTEVIVRAEASVHTEIVEDEPPPPDTIISRVERKITIVPHGEDMFHDNPDNANIINLYLGDYEISFFDPIDRIVEGQKEDIIVGLRIGYDHPPNPFLPPITPLPLSPTPYSYDFLIDRPLKLILLNVDGGVPGSDCDRIEFLDPNGNSVGDEIEIRTDGIEG